MGASRHLGGWAAEVASEIDRHDPGFLGELHRADDGRRQVLFAALSRLRLSGRRLASPSAARRLGPWLRKASLRRIIERSFGGDPQGFRRALAKCGPAARTPRFYGELHALYAEPRREKEARALSHLRAIQASDLAKLDVLDPVARSPSILAALRTLDDAKAFASMLRVIRMVCSTATDEALKASFGGVHNREELRETVDRWIDRADRFPPPPSPDCEHLKALASAEDMQRAARDFRNCLKSCVTEVIAGEAYYFRWYGTPPAIVKVVPDAPLGWRVEEIHGPKNRRIPRARLEPLLAELSRLGLEQRAAWREAEGRLSFRLW